MTDIIVIGAGGLGREVLWTIERINQISQTWNIVGVCDDATDRFEGSVSSYLYLGDVESAVSSNPQAAFVIAIGNNEIREKIYSKYKDRHYPAIIDPSAVVAPSSKIGKGTFVAPGAIVAVDTSIGDFAIVNQHARMGHDSSIGDFSQLAPGVGVCGNVKIGRSAFLGVNSSVLPGMRIGDGAKVSAGIPVCKNLSAGEVFTPYGIFS
ncbi:MAG: NeuD/PglB/VioB family sugar acetyltransferase [Kiritimatiellae bacterium]|nr:NeuD/PglB/VioB family sugar acetyltransferase [Kiritimatiellia bacterium]